MASNYIRHGISQGFYKEIVTVILIELTVRWYLLYTESMDRAHTRLWDFPSAAILTLALLTVSERLYVTGWTSGLETVPLLTLIGAILGITLGASNFKRRAVFWLAFGYSVPVIVLGMGGILHSSAPGLESMISLAGRLMSSIVLFMTAQPVKDTALFITVVSIGFWIVSLTSGYVFTRSGNFAGAVVPAGIALVIIQLYASDGHDFLLGVYFFLCLLLLGRLMYARKRLFWKEQRVALLAESRTELNLVLLATTFLLVVLAWTTPTLGHTFSAARKFWGNITRPLQDLQNDLGHIVAGIEGGEDTGSVISYSDSLSLGQQAETGDALYLRILSPVNQNANRYYWRARAYNVYSNGKWFTEGMSSEPFTSNQTLISLPEPWGVTGRFTFISQQANLSILVTPARPVWVSNPSELIFLQASDGKIDPILFRPDLSILAGEKYVVQANTFEPTVTQLRSAGENYPAWVTDHYLQLPEDLPPQVTDLAQRITSRSKTIYDMASAITIYLRSHITYSTSVQSAPAGLDPLAWFLFDSKTGFCNYYASAEVILLRSAGIPSRLAVGFAQGEFEPPNHYTVLQSDAHAWPEVYFPGIGWIEFEPTVSQPPLTRPWGVSVPPGTQTVTEDPNGTAESNIPGGETPVAGGIGGPGSGSAASANSVFRSILFFVLVIVMVITVLLISPFGVFDKILVRTRRNFQKPFPVLMKNLLEKLSFPSPGWLERWAYFAGLNPIERAFAVVYRSLRWFGVKVSPAQTPAKTAVVLAGRLPEASEEIRSLLHEYQRSLYSRESGNLHKARSANKVIWRKTIRAVLRKYWKVLQK